MKPMLRFRARGWNFRQKKTKHFTDKTMKSKKKIKIDKLLIFIFRNFRSVSMYYWKMVFFILDLHHFPLSFFLSIQNVSLWNVKCYICLPVEYFFWWQKIWVVHFGNAHTPNAKKYFWQTFFFVFLWLEFTLCDF